MGINKIIYNNNTLIDLTDTTATASDVVEGTYFYTNAGVKTEGTIVDGDEMEYGSAAETWYFNESLSVPMSYTYIALDDISFESNNTSYTKLDINPLSATVVYMTYGSDFAYGPYYSPDSAVWMDESYRTITITGGVDAQDATFRTWLEANATKQ